MESTTSGGTAAHRPLRASHPTAPWRTSTADKRRGMSESRVAAAGASRPTPQVSTQPGPCRAPKVPEAERAAASSSAACREAGSRQRVRVGPPLHVRPVPGQLAEGDGEVQAPTEQEGRARHTPEPTASVRVRRGEHDEQPRVVRLGRAAREQQRQRLPSVQPAWDAAGGGPAAVGTLSSQPMGRHPSQVSASVGTPSRTRGSPRPRSRWSASAANAPAGGTTSNRRHRRENASEPNPAGAVPRATEMPWPPTPAGNDATGAALRTCGGTVCHEQRRRTREQNLGGTNLAPWILLWSPAPVVPTVAPQKRYRRFCGATRSRVERCIQ